MTGLIILNLTVATGFLWVVFPLFCWGIGLTLGEPRAVPMAPAAVDLSTAAGAGAGQAGTEEHHAHH